MSPRQTVLIAGAGPAGSALALTLASAGQPVILVEQSGYDRLRVGELLSPSGQQTLRELLPETYQEFFLSRIGVTGVWNSSEVEAYPQESWWTLDRTGLDRALAQAADRAGAEFIGDTRVKKAERLDGRWRVQVGDRVCWADWLVDATGRASQLGRMFGAVRKRYDRQVALVAFLQGEGSPPQELLLETVATGWWYSAPIAPGQAVAVFLTDSDLDKGEAEAAWRAGLASSVQTKQRYQRFSFVEKPRRVAADCSLLVPCVGEGWMAVGDAASAFDPLSSRGVGRAASEGAKLGRMLLEALAAGEAPPLLTYAEEVGNSFVDHQAKLAGDYRQAHRFAREPFWARRMSGMGAGGGSSRVRTQGLSLRQRALIFPEGQRFECSSCGKCCRSSWSPEVEPRAAEKIREHFRELPLRTLDDGRILLPRAQDGACGFLKEDDLCGLQSGSSKPLACRQFPFLFRETPEGIVVGVSHLCRSVQRNQGRELSSYEAELRDLLEERPPVVLDRSFPVSWGRTVDWDTYQDLERFLLAGGNIPDQVRRLRYYLARFLKGGALELEGEVPTAALYEIECTLALYYLAKVEGGDPLEHWNLVEQMSQGRSVRLPGSGWEGPVAELKSLIDVEGAPWLGPEIERYLRSLIERKFLLVQATLFGNLLVLAALPHLLLLYTVIHQLRRGGSTLERDDFEKTVDLMELSLVTFGRQEIPARVFFKLDLDLC